MVKLNIEKEHIILPKEEGSFEEFSKRIKIEYLIIKETL